MKDVPLVPPDSPLPVLYDTLWLLLFAYHGMEWNHGTRVLACFHRRHRLLVALVRHTFC